MRKTVCIVVALTSAVLMTSCNVLAFTIGEMGSIDDQMKQFEPNESFHLSDDFWEKNGLTEDIFDTAGGLEMAENRFNFTFRMEDLQEEYENADFQYKDDSTYIVVYKSRGMDIPYTTTHVLLLSANSLNPAEDGSGLCITGNDGELLYFMDAKHSQDIESGTAKTNGREIALRTDGTIYTPPSGVSWDELQSKNVTALFQSSYPFFWQELQSVSETEAEETETEVVQSEEEEEQTDVVDREEAVKSAIGMVTPGEYYVFQCSAGMPFDDVGALMASYGCTYAAKIDSTEAYLDGEQVFGGNVPDGYNAEESD